MTVGGGALDALYICFATLARGVEGAAPYGFCPTNPNLPGWATQIPICPDGHH